MPMARAFPAFCLLFRHTSRATKLRDDRIDEPERPGDPLALPHAHERAGGSLVWTAPHGPEDSIKSDMPVSAGQGDAPG